MYIHYSYERYSKCMNSSTSKTTLSSQNLLYQIKKAMKHIIPNQKGISANIGKDRMETPTHQVIYWHR